ncbi:ankyrin repeat-containing domain protein [Hypomontagnella submonticulosa]|nr:ankyrin repeat-containing domain protein [Hypomontagnella submonticulosa]
MQETSWCQERMSQEMHNNVIRKFQQKSQGMFQWAAVHINDLLELESESLVGEYLHKLPEDLKVSYDEIYQSIDRRKRHIADRAFQWMICSWKPLSPKDLVIAVLQDPKSPFVSKFDIDIDMVLKTCKNLVIIEKSEEGEICRFAHLSIQEYLESYHFTPEKANGFVLDVHMRYLIDRSRHSQSNYIGPWYWDDRMISWYRQNKAFVGKIPEATRDLMIRFLGAPGKSSLAYKSWIAALSNSIAARLDFPSRCESVFHSIRLGPPWVCCVVLEVYDVLRHWLERQAMQPQRFVLGRATALDLTWCHEEPLIWNTLVEFGIGLNAKTKGGGTPLIDIADRGDDNLEKVQLLLENGADPNLTYNPQKTALHRACYYGQIKMVKLLLANGANVNSNFPIIGTPLNVAAGRGLYDICKVLIAAGADVNIFSVTDNGLWTPLMDAIAIGNVRTVRLLISKGANMNAITPEGITPIHAAIDSDEGLGCIYALIKLGVDVNLYSHQYGSPLYYAVARHKHVPQLPHNIASVDSIRKTFDDTILALRQAGAVLDSAHAEPDDIWIVNRLNATTWLPVHYSSTQDQI